VQFVRTAGERFALKPFDAFIRDAVIVRVGELPDARRRGDVQRPVQELRAFRKHHPVGEHCAPVEFAVAILVLEPHDAMRPLLQLLFHLVVRPRRLGNVQPALVIERRHNWPLGHRRTRHELDRKAGRDFELRWR
jgi:hypothetical protein